jgi:hypothetical protein
VRVWAILFSFVIFYGWTTSNAAGNPDDGAYEIDYEEEVEEVEDSAPPKSAPPASKVKKIGGGPAVQGSRAKNRFAPILKSETRSVYKKDGKSLDVDTD